MYCSLGFYFVIILSAGIIHHPQSQSINLTQNAIFKCDATGNNTQYQWIIKSGVFPTKAIGIFSNTLTIPDVKSSDENTYTCIVSNRKGNIYSNSAHLTIVGMW